ncbi:MAG: epoxyqueuosine reductase [Syntrophaceae bacterium]
MRSRMEHRYRRFSWLTDVGGIKSALAEMRGLGMSEQPRLNREYGRLPNDPALDEAWFSATLTEMLVSHPENRLEYPFGRERIYDAPLVGFVAGDDPLFDDFKRIIGPHHFTPAEIMAWQARNQGVAAPKPEDISVVCLVMPFTKATINDNTRQKEWLSERWAQTRLLGEIFSQTLVREMVSLLMHKGILAVAPDATPLFRKKHYPKVGWASPWSHRHVAYAAGLGTFGLHDFLITEKGSAHRIASFVVNLRLEPNRTRPEDIHAYCLHYQGRTCMICAHRCPAQAISASGGHDKEACAERCKHSIAYVNNNFHIFIYGCGLCSTGVPCATGIPKALCTQDGAS